jgi:transcriptional regulator with XRE-family HTH domain
MRKSNEDTTLAKLRVAAHFSQKEMAEFLGIPRHTVQNIELKKTELGEELARDVSSLFSVKLDWLLDGDTTAPMVNREGKPIVDLQKHFAVRQAEITGRDFRPETNRDLWNVTNALADNFGRVAALLLRALECGQFELYDYKLRSAMRKIYEDGGKKKDSAWTELPVKAVFHGERATATRPDLTALLDEWETRFKKITHQKSGGKLPLKYPQIKSLPAIQPPIAASKPKGKSAKPTRY